MSIYQDMAVVVRQMTWFKDQIIYEDGLPDKPDDAVCVRVFGGHYERIHNRRRPSWTVYGIEFRVRSNRPSVCLDRCNDIADHIGGLVNESINGVLYRSIIETSPAVEVARDPEGQVTYSIAFTATRRGTP